MSEADLLAHRVAHDPRSHLWRDEEPQPDPAHTVGEVMSRAVVSLGPDADTASIAELMLDGTCAASRSWPAAAWSASSAAGTCCAPGPPDAGEPAPT